MLEGPSRASNINITPKGVPKNTETIEKPKEVRPNRFQFCQLMEHMNSLLQGGWVNQVKAETSWVGASIASVSAEVGSMTVGKGAEAISSLKSLLKPQLPKKVK